MWVLRLWNYRFFSIFAIILDCTWANIFQVFPRPKRIKNLQKQYITVSWYQQLFPDKLRKINVSKKVFFSFFLFVMPAVISYKCLRRHKPQWDLRSSVGTSNHSHYRLMIHREICKWWIFYCRYVKPLILSIRRKKIFVLKQFFLHFQKMFLVFTSNMPGSISIIVTTISIGWTK